MKTNGLVRMKSKPCPAERCRGKLMLYEGKDGGQVFNAPVMFPDKMYIRAGWHVEVRAGDMWGCNRCEHCEAAS